MRTIVRGTAEDFDVDLTADVPLTTQPVEVRIGREGEPWRPAAWTGDAGTARSAFVVLSEADTAALDPLSLPVFARVTHDDKRPITYLGNVNVV